MNATYDGVYVSDVTAANISEPESGYDEAQMRNLERIVSITVPIFFAIVVFIGFFGNLLVVLVVTFNKQMRNTTNLLILNLAVADLLFVVICVPSTGTIYALPHDWPYGDVWCKLVQYLIIAMAYVSIYTLVFMSLDRFLAVVYPIESMTLRTESNCRKAIIATWIFTVVGCLPLLFANGEVHPPGTTHSYCGFLDNQTIPFVPSSMDSRWSLFAFQTIFFITAYLLPLLLIIGLYSIMLHRLWNQQPGGRASAESIKNKKRVIKLVLIVVVLFALSWLPIHIILVLRAMGKYVTSPASISLQVISQILAYSNSCVNPILYAFLSQPFRRGFWAVITCIRPSGPHGVQQNGYEITEVVPKKNKTHGGGGMGHPSTSPRGPPLGAKKTLAVSVRDNNPANSTATTSYVLEATSAAQAADKRISEDPTATGIPAVKSSTGSVNLAEKSTPSITGAKANGEAEEIGRANANGDNDVNE